MFPVPAPTTSVRVGPVLGVRTMKPPASWSTSAVVSASITVSTSAWVTAEASATSPVPLASTATPKTVAAPVPPIRTREDVP